MQHKRHQRTFIGERSQDFFNCLKLETTLRAAKSEMAGATKRDPFCETKAETCGRQHKGNCFHYHLSCMSYLSALHESCTLKLSMNSLIRPTVRASKMALICFHCVTQRHITSCGGSSKSITSGCQWAMEPHFNYRECIQVPPRGPCCRHVANAF